MATTKKFVRVETEYPQIESGAEVYIKKSALKNESEDTKKYCIVEFCEGYYVLADNKEDLKEGLGSFYTTDEIEKYQVEDTKR